MILTEREALIYLMARHWVSPRAVVDGDLKVIDASRRNHNFKVLSRRGPSFLLKQGIGTERSDALAHEAAVYRALSAPGAGHGFAAHLPRFYGYDEKEGILVLEFVKDGLDLRHRHVGRGRFPRGPAASLGRTLADLHRLRIDPAGAPDLAPRMPWIFFIHQPDLRMIHRMSQANRRFVGIMQQFPELGDALRGLLGRWRPEAFIHSDLRWDNCVTTPSPRMTLKLVDWELATTGDPCWDLGSVFSDYVSAWLFSIPISYDDDPDRFPGLARFPLESMQPAMASFWNAYAARRAMKLREARESLTRAAGYAAVRLLQTAFEHLQTSSQLSGSLVYLLQLSLNMLARPKEAIVHLLGIAG